jgi:hypothetical protein
MVRPSLVNAQNRSLPIQAHGRHGDEASRRGPSPPSGDPPRHLTQQERAPRPTGEVPCRHAHDSRELMVSSCLQAEPRGREEKMND